MTKTKDFENLWFRYKTEAEPKNISINQFCMQNGIQYNQFNKWFRSTRKDIIPVVIDEIPEEAIAQDPLPPVQEEGQVQKQPRGDIKIIIRTGGGLNIQQKNLDYQGLKNLIIKLEGLC